MSKIKGKWKDRLYNFLHLAGYQVGKISLALLLIPFILLLLVALTLLCILIGDMIHDKLPSSDYAFIMATLIAVSSWLIGLYFLQRFTNVLVEKINAS